MRAIIPVISGKGGVGKSTVAVNLAVALAKKGAQVALVDSDFYGPSVPTLLGWGEVKTDSEGRIIPPVKFGVKYISIAFFLPDENSAVIWRGPMLNKALNQLFRDVSWGVVDYCIVDMPPGTGDIAISLSQNFQVTGAVIVTTPQEVALADVRKAINMLKKVNVDLLGIVENMSAFTASDGTTYDIFGSGGGEKLASEFGTKLLAKIPLDPMIREGGDKGEPIVVKGGSKTASIFEDLAGEISTAVESKLKSQSKLQVVS